MVGKRYFFRRAAIIANLPWQCEKEDFQLFQIASEPNAIASGEVAKKPEASAYGSVLGRHEVI